MNFNIYELLYMLQNTHNILGIVLVVVGMIGMVISFVGAMISESIKTALMFLIVFFLSGEMVVYGSDLESKSKLKIVSNYITKYNLDRCEVLKELSKFDKGEWLDVYYNECIKGGE